MRSGEWRTPGVMIVGIKVCIVISEIVSLKHTSRFFVKLDVGNICLFIQANFNV